MEQEEISEEVIKKRKKRLLTDYNKLDRDSTIATLQEIRSRLRNHFKLHIGEENPTDSAEIFERVLGVNPYSIDMFRRMWWWAVIKKILSEMRREEVLFVVNRGQNYFVLKTQKESNDYKNKLQRDIVSMRKSMVKADAWVRKKKYLKF